MERFMWSFDGKKYSDAPDPIRFRYGERVRLTLNSDEATLTEEQIETTVKAVVDQLVAEIGRAHV